MTTSLPGPLAATTRGSGPRLVLLHGFTQTARSWDRIGVDLETDHEVVAVDAPGHGDSGDSDADLDEAADLLVATGGRATYVGYSMGGRIALHAALAHPHDVRRLVLIGATPGLASEEERTARRREDEALAVALERDGLDAFLDRWLALPLFAGLPPDAAQRDERMRNTVAGLASSLRHCGTGCQRNLRSELAALRMPILLITGAEDPKFTALAAEMTGLMGSNGEHVVIEGAGHSVHLERPEDFLATVRRWLREHPLDD